MKKPIKKYLRVAKNKSKIFIQKSKLTPFILPFIFFLLFTTIAFHRHLNLQSTMFDLGLMHQKVWTTLNGVYMHTSHSRPILEDTPPFAIEGAFRPILNLFVPIYAFLADPLVLIFAQVSSVALASIPIYLFAKDRLKSSFAGLILQIAYFLYPQTQNMTLFDFHPITFSVAFLSWGFYLLHKNKLKPAIILLILSMFGREINSLTVSAIGIYFFLIKKKPKTGLFFTLIGTIYFLFVFLVLLEYFRSSETMPYFRINTIEGYSHFKWLGSDLPEAVKTIATKPLLILQRLVEPTKINYIKFLSNPFFYLNLTSPIIITTIPNLFLNLLSEKSNLRSGMFHYESGIIVFFFFSAVTSLNYIRKLLKKRFPIKKSVNIFTIILLFLISSFFSQFTKTQTPFLTQQRIKNLFSGKLVISDHAKKISSFQKIIEPKYSLTTQNNLGPHFAGRMNIYIFPTFSHQSDFILLDLYDPYTETISKPCGVCIHPISHQEYFHQLSELFLDENYGVMLFEDGYLLLKKGYKRNLNQATYSQIKQLIDTN